MHNIKDLNIESEIVPLFDYTHNNYAKEVLCNLFITIPKTQEAIYDRQNTIKAVLLNIEKIKRPSYYRVDLEEIYQFTSNIIQQENVYEKSKIKRIIKSITAKEKRQQLMGKVIQLIITVNKIYDQYFSSIEISLFPLSFKNRLGEMIDFFTSLQTNHYVQLISNDMFRYSHMDKMLEKITSNRSKEQLRFVWDSFFLFEAYVSIARGIIKNNFTFPVFQEREIEIIDFYHPLLREPVKNNLTFDRNVMLLTGPNMSGKSTLLKSIGLCVYLSHIGFAVPAKSFKTPFFSSIFIFINSRDDIRSGYSHFMTEIINLKNALIASKEEKVFAIFDELFRGTNIDDALDITDKTLVGLSIFFNSYFLISTHLYQLDEHTDDNYNHIRCYYLDCKVKNNNPIFYYNIKAGWSRMRIGKILFEKEGLLKLLEGK